jgi:hypothetical protein
LFSPLATRVESLRSPEEATALHMEHWAVDSNAGAKMEINKTKTASMILFFMLYKYSE